MRITGPSPVVPSAIPALAALAAGAFFAFAAHAADSTPLASLARLATALSANDSDSALEYFDPGMKVYPEIEQKLEALTAQADISCSIDIVTEEESGGVHKLDLDWFMQLKAQGDEGQLERRRERVKVEMRLVKGTWKITAFSPVAVLDTIHLR